MTITLSISIQKTIRLAINRSTPFIIWGYIFPNMEIRISLMLFLTHSISFVISFFNMFLLYFGQVVEEIGIFARELRPRGFFGSKFPQVVYADR